jgi:hypothetical protein
MLWVGLRAQAPNPTEPQLASSPRPAKACCGYNYPRRYDAEVADGAVHRILFEDELVMLMEVSNPPLLDVFMHGHPFISVFARDSDFGGRHPNAPANPRPRSVPLEEKSPYNDMGGADAPPPQGLKWPICTPAAPQAPHTSYNVQEALNHFYRLEFFRVEGEEFQQHWKEWYPSMAASVKPIPDLVPGPALGPKMSDEWPYPLAYDSINAAPNNYRVLYEDQKMRLVEVTVRPGERTPMHGHPYPSVLAFNSISGNPADVIDTKMDPSSPLNGQGAGHAGPPKVHNLKTPTCATMNRQAPHSIQNKGKAPLHYYRIEYKRIDGTDIIKNWKHWYPWTQYMQFTRKPVD